MATVGVVSADHGGDYGDVDRCVYSTTTNGGDYNVEIQILETERGYYFDMDGDAEVTMLASDRYRVHFDVRRCRRAPYVLCAGTFAQGERVCEVHGAFRVKAE